MTLSSETFSSFGSYIFRFHSLNNEFEFLSPRLLDIIGYSLQEVNALGIQKLIKRVDRSYETNNDTGTGTITVREVMIAGANGKEFWFDEFSVKVKGKTGKIIGTEGYFRRNDVLQESSGEARTAVDIFTRLFKEFNGNSFVCDHNCIISATPEFMAAFSLAPAAFRNKIGLNDIFSADIVNILNAAMKEVLPNRPIIVPDIQPVISSGREMTVKVSSVKVLKTPYFAVQFFAAPPNSAGNETDEVKATVTETVTAPASEPIIETPKYLSAENALFRKKTAELLSIISHDMKVPIGALMGLTKIISLDREHLTDEEMNRILSGVAELSGSLLLRLEDLIELTRLELNLLKEPAELLSISSTINDELEKLYQSFKKKNITPELSSVSGLFIMAPKMLFVRMIKHLLDNMLKFTPQGSKVFLRVSDNNDMVQLECLNSSEPIPESAVRNFNSGVFTYVTHGTENETGNGLGLKIIFHTITQLSGTISVSSDEQGFRVLINLPKGN